MIRRTFEAALDEASLHDKTSGSGPRDVGVRSKVTKEMWDKIETAVHEETATDEEQAMYNRVQKEIDDLKNAGSEEARHDLCASLILPVRGSYFAAL